MATRLIVQPEDGLRPILSAITRAKASIDLSIFRFDLPEMEQALAAAVGRGVVVRALVAHTNNNGEKQLRELEDRLLGYGVTIDRTPDDLLRYHYKVLVVDNECAFVLGFNYTKLDMLKSRSFGVALTGRQIIKDVRGLLEADANRQKFRPQHPTLIISPDNARTRLSAFLRDAQSSIAIYDPNVSDDAMIRILKARVAAGVGVRILGKLKKRWRDGDLHVQPCPLKRLHVRAIIRDGRAAFIGSQSLRRIELDERREAGVIVRAPGIVKQLVEIFDTDWQSVTSPSSPPS